MNRRWAAALIVSVLVNVFLIGGGAGIMLSGGRIVAGRLGRRPQPPNIWLAAQALPQPDRFHFRTMLRERALALRPQLETARLARREAAALIAAPAYDADAVGVALAQARSAESRARAEMDAAVVAYLVQMTPPERKALADALVIAGPGRVRAQIRAADSANRVD